MKYIEEAIKKAVEGGYEGVSYGNGNWSGCRTVTFDRISKEYPEVIFFDPSFWQSLGKSEGWHKPKDFWTLNAQYGFTGRWENEWHCFVKYLSDGKDAESFFELLLNKKE